MGTPSYLSPEQIEGRPVDGRSGQFSLVVVAFEMFTGSAFGRLAASGHARDCRFVVCSLSGPRGPELIGEGSGSKGANRRTRFALSEAVSAQNVGEIAKAARLFRRSAELRSARAMMKLGEI